MLVAAASDIALALDADEVTAFIGKMGARLTATA